MVKTLANTSKSSNLQLCRFIAAALVIYSHAYPLMGFKAGDIARRLSGGKTTFGAIAVAILFLCSGFLIAKSVERKSAFIDFLFVRIVRIIPPLAFTVFFIF